MDGRSRRGIVLVAVLAVMILGCKKDEEQTGENGEGQAEATDELPDENEPPPVGRIEGIVRLAAGAVLPAYPATALFGEQAPCPAPNEDDRRPVKLGEGRAVWNIPVFLSGVPPEQVHVREMHRLGFHECHLLPAVVTATVGDRLQILNESTTTFQPVLGDKFDELRTLRPHREQLFLLDSPTLTYVHCPLGRFCGRADLLVLSNGFHSVTGHDGRFTIDQVPADTEVAVHVWHPLFREATATVTAVADDPTPVEIIVEPAPVGIAVPSAALFQAAGSPQWQPRVTRIDPNAFESPRSLERPVEAPEPSANPTPSAEGEGEEGEPAAPPPPAYTPEELRTAL